jgi:hypothetical protein
MTEIIVLSKTELEEILARVASTAAETALSKYLAEPKPDPDSWVQVDKIAQKYHYHSETLLQKIRIKMIPTKLCREEGDKRAKTAIQQKHIHELIFGENNMVKAPRPMLNKKSNLSNAE